MPAQINWQMGGHPENVEKMLADIEKLSGGDTQYVLVHIADLRWMLQQFKTFEDERERIEKVRVALDEYDSSSASLFRRK